MCEIEGEESGEFGLMDRFCHLILRVKCEDVNSSLHLIDKLSKILPLNATEVTDDLGVTWEVVRDNGCEIEIYLDRIVGYYIVGKEFEFKGK